MLLDEYPKVFQDFTLRAHRDWFGRRFYSASCHHCTTFRSPRKASVEYVRTSVRNHLVSAHGWLDSLVEGL